MNFQFEVIRASRNNMLSILENLTIEQINKIPEGFNNNLVWNFGHVIVTQQLLHYGLSGLPMHLPNTVIESYRKGSKPEALVSKSEFDSLKQAAFDLIDKLKKDYDNGIFKNYKNYTTSYNVTLSNIDDAIVFNNVHEGLHLGSMMALRKLV